MWGSNPEQDNHFRETDLALSSWYIYTKNVLDLTPMERAIFELWCKVQVSHVPLRLCSLILLLSGYQHI